MNDLSERLNRIEEGQHATQDWAQRHDIHDAGEFDEIKRRDAVATETRVRIEQTLEEVKEALALNTENVKGLATKEDMEAITPLLEAIAGGRIAITWGRVVYKFLVSIGALAMAWLAIKRL